jgi:hypothetical protein
VRRCTPPVGTASPLVDIPAADALSASMLALLRELLGIASPSPTDADSVAAHIMALVRRDDALARRRGPDRSPG